MNLKLEIEFSKAPILQDVDALKKQIDDVRPLSPEIEARVMQKLRLDWNYNSNAIEGNKLSYGETTALLMHGITAKGKPLKDHLDIKGHNEAVGYLDRIIKDERDFMEADIRALHEILLVESGFAEAETEEGLPTRKRIEIGKYKSSPNHVKTATGETHFYASPEETPALMNDLMDWYVAATIDKEVHPIVIAALFHHKFVEIHPFDDGNGRTARILMNLILMKNGYPPVIIKNDTKDNYYALLSQADVGDDFPFIEFIIDGVQRSLQLYIKAINGGDIDEDEDIDKEIALFKMELQNKVQLKERKSPEIVKRILETDIIDVFRTFAKKSNEFDDFFFDNIKMIQIKYLNYKDEANAITILDFDADLKLGEDFKSVEAVYFYCELEKFKSSANVFNITVIWRVEFEEYQYSITNDTVNGTLSKLYHENITKNDRQNLVKRFINELKENIQNELKRG